MTKSNTVESILSDDQRTSLSKDNLSINRLRLRTRTILKRLTRLNATFMQLFFPHLLSGLVQLRWTLR